MPARRLLILSSSTGGGHDMRADALAQWVERSKGNEVRIRRYQALEESSSVDRFGVDLYNWIQRRCPWAHHVYFNFLEIAGLHRKVPFLQGRKRLQAIVREFHPDVVLSTHAHLNHAFFTAIRQAMADDPPRCLTYCGELHGSYGFSRHWVNPRADGFIAAVPACAEAARERGMPEARIHLGGFLLKPAFFEDAKTNDAPELAGEREALFGKPVHGPVILLGTGANGANNHLAIIRSLRALKQPINLIALCGNDEAALRSLETISSPPHTIRPLGYRDDMHRLLQLADLAFIRPGTGSTSECIQARCPIFFNGIGGVMPQERITLNFLRSLGLQPQIVSRPAQFGAAVDRLLDKPDSQAALDEQRSTFSRINRGLTPERIVAEVLK
jgi:processive 1,2-diacylglycerol beta-glucosyltransferase